MTTQRTRSQDKIINFLKTLNRPVSAQELYLELRNHNLNMGLATVYRSLEALKLQGEIKVRTLASGESVYSSQKKDQHYLTCINCGTSVGVNECPVHELETRLETEQNFKIYYHTLEFFGVCQQCQPLANNG